MTKELEKNPDNVHKDILEVHQIKLEDKPYMLRQRRKADDIYASKKLFDGITEEHFRKAFPGDVKVLDTYFKDSDNSFFSGTYWSKVFMLDAMYNFLYELCPTMRPEELDIVISVDDNNKPQLEVKYYDYEENDWVDWDFTIHPDEINSSNVTSWQEDLANGIESLEPEMDARDDRKLATTNLKVVKKEDEK